MTACGKFFNAVQIGALILAWSFASTASDLEKDRVSPPNAAKPGIWWYWGESVTTDHGITKDLEALKRAGFGGVVLYEQFFTDRPEALNSLSPQWLARLRFAAAECARIGLTLEVNASDGYVAGGPWITPELAMQRLVASETNVDGGCMITMVLPQPETRLNFYRDVAVLAYPTLAGGGAADLPPRVFMSEKSGIAFKEDFTYSAKDIRFTTKGATLYAISLGWPEKNIMLIGTIEIQSAKSAGDFTVSVRAKDATSWTPINLASLRFTPVTD